MGSESHTASYSNPCNITAGATTQIPVETAADGSGIVVPAQNLMAGSCIKVYAIAGDAVGNFVENVLADSRSLVNKSGGI